MASVTDPYDNILGFLDRFPYHMDSFITLMELLLSLCITLERLERFRPNLVHTLLYVCVRILCMFYIYSAGRMAWEAGNLDDSNC
jgi:hypothetical protein